MKEQPPSVKKAKRPTFLVEDEAFVSDTKAAFLGKSTLITSGILYTLVLMLIAGFIWAYFGEIDQSTSAEGKVIPASEDKLIQSLDGGVIADILVHEGDIVKHNQILVRFDDTRYSSDYRTDYEQYLALSATVARLSAESENSQKIDFPTDVLKEKPELAARETKLFETRRQDLKAEMTNLQSDLENATKEMNAYKPLLKSGAVSEIEYLHTLRTMADIKQRMLEKQDKFNESIWTDLNQHKATLLSLNEKLKSLKDKMNRSELRSPVYGIVKKIHIKTVGGVINPGMDIMDIVPLSDSLLIQARIKPSDIAFIRVGQPASVKVSAFDYTIYGSLQGKVEFISPDAIEEPNPYSARGGSQLSYFLVNIRTPKTYFMSGNKKFYITPGMSTMVQIKTGKKTVLRYLLKPIIKAKEEAMTER